MVDVEVEARRAGHEVRGSTTLRRMVRLGLVAYGVVHLLLAWLALRLAFGERSGSVDNTGALHEVAEQPFGEVALWLIGVGFVALVVWKALDALIGHTDRDGAGRWAARGLSAFKAVVYGVLAGSAFDLASGSGGGSSGDKSADTWTARLMEMPAGPWLVVLVGLAIVGYGVGQVVIGVTDRWEKHLDLGGRTGDRGRVITVLARTGYPARGVALGIVGGLFVWAGLTHSPRRSGGLDAALGQLVQAPFGPVLLCLVALGVAAYGLFCFARARHLSRS